MFNVATVEEAARLIQGQIWIRSWQQQGSTKKQDDTLTYNSWMELSVETSWKYSEVNK